MKFGLFYQMQLPKPLDSDDWEPGQEAELFRNCLEEIELADKVGFDHVWLAEHHFTGEYNHLSAPDVMLGAIAARTKNIRVGHSIVQMMPANNHPVKVAENVATIDLISNGRMDFGVGIGGATEQDAFWPELIELAKAGKTHEIMWEATRECIRLMTMTPYPGYAGAYLNLPVVNVVPKPQQLPHPPLWLAVTSERSLMMAAERGMGALCLAQGGPDVVEKRVEAYWARLHQGITPIGAAINPVVATFANTLIAPTDEAAFARERGGAAFTNYAIRRAHETTHGIAHFHRELASAKVVAPSFAHVADSVTERAHAEKLASQGTMDAAADSPGNIIGSPETARKKILGYEATGVDILNFVQQVGTRRHEDIMESIELAGKLLPEFKDRHGRGGAARQERLDRLGYQVNLTM
jgi:alkanesulfonate monooxygenase SsuD/methylene tetrahydromethanopterin reductase-like flavin-dependent oxidoreductase (luciferase family)